MSRLIVAAPSSGAGKTVVTLALLRALSRNGPIRGAKIGPDYIDPAFHTVASGRASMNLDPFAMSHDRIAGLMAGPDPLLIEAAMGLFDGAGPGAQGAAIHLARDFDVPVLLLLDATGSAQSLAAVALGMVQAARPARVAGIVVNRVASPRHAAMIRAGFAAMALDGLPPIIGMIGRDERLVLPSRHLGLIQARETDALSDWIEVAADIVREAIDLTVLRALFSNDGAATDGLIAAAGQRPPQIFQSAQPLRSIAVAQDDAFSFLYPHLLQDWRRAGIEIMPFSPLADDAVPEADLVVLPGGYPELHAARISAAGRFLNSLREAAQNTDIYGECGGYMVLGDTLTDAGGQIHWMAGLLPLETTFAQRRLHLGYRRLIPRGGPFCTPLGGHEFHYATTLRAEGSPLFAASDADGAELPDMGLIKGRVCGSFAHVIDVLDHGARST